MLILLCDMADIRPFLWQLRREGLLKGDLTDAKVIENYRYATDNGILKVMSKMGISTIQSYKGELARIPTAESSS